MTKNHKNIEVAALLSESNSGNQRTSDEPQKKSKDQRTRKHPGGSTRLPNYAHGRTFVRSKPHQPRIRHQGRRLSLGVYATKKEADEAYARAVSRIDQGLPPVVD